MARHLCVVARDWPLLVGYLMIVLEKSLPAGDRIEIVVDRRGDAARDDPPHPGPERRVDRGVDRALAGRGYALVTLDGPAGAPPPRRVVMPAHEIEPAPRRRRPRGAAAGTALAVVVLLAAVALLGAAGLGAWSMRAVLDEGGARAAAAWRRGAHALAGRLAVPEIAALIPSRPLDGLAAAPAPPPGDAPAPAARLPEPAPPAPADEPPRVELAAHRERGAGRAHTVYTARVVRPDGRPLVGAEVSIRGTLPDGRALDALLRATAVPGLYRGRAGTGRRALEHVRVVVVTDGQRHELAVP